MFFMRISIRVPGDGVIILCLFTLILQLLLVY
jgi:hypothetical protein